MILKSFKLTEYQILVINLYAFIAPKYLLITINKIRNFVSLKSNNFNNSENLTGKFKNFTKE